MFYIEQSLVAAPITEHGSSEVTFLYTYTTKRFICSIRGLLWNRLRHMMLEPCKHGAKFLFFLGNWICLDGHNCSMGQAGWLWFLEQKNMRLPICYKSAVVDIWKTLLSKRTWCLKLDWSQHITSGLETLPHRTIVYWWISRIRKQRFVST